LVRRNQRGEGGNSQDAEVEATYHVQVIGRRETVDSALHLHPASRAVS
jgi:hypothetical protein